MVARRKLPRVSVFPMICAYLWQDDDVLGMSSLSEGHDLPGNFVLGDRTLERALRRLDAPIPHRRERPDRRADR